MLEGYLLDIERVRRDNQIYFKLYLWNNGKTEVVEDKNHYEFSFWMSPRRYGVHVVNEVKKAVDRIEDLTEEDVVLTRDDKDDSIFKVTVGNPFYKSKVVDELWDKFEIMGDKRSFTSDYMARADFRPYDYLLVENGEITVDRKKSRILPDLETVVLDIETDNPGIMPFGETETACIGFATRKSTNILTHSREASEVPGVRTVMFENEADMLSNIMEYMHYPFIYHFNGFNYDFPVLGHRFNHHFSEKEAAALFPFNKKRGGVEMKRKEGGFIYSIPGVQNIDFFPIKKRDYGLPSNKLKPTIKYWLNKEPIDEGTNIHELWNSGPDGAARLIEYNAADVVDLLAILDKTKRQEVDMEYGQRMRMFPQALNSRPANKICLHYVQCLNPDNFLYNEQFNIREFTKIRDGYRSPFYKKGRYSDVHVLNKDLLKTFIISEFMSDSLNRDNRSEIVRTARNFLTEATHLRKTFAETGDLKRDTASRLITTIASELPSLIIDPNYYSGDVRFEEKFVEESKDLSKKYRNFILFENWRYMWVEGRHIEDLFETLNELTYDGQYMVYNNFQGETVDMVVINGTDYAMIEPISDQLITRGIKVRGGKAPSKLNEIAERAVYKAVLHGGDAMMDYLKFGLGQLEKAELTKEDWLYEGWLNQPVNSYKHDYPFVQAARQMRPRPKPREVFRYGVRYLGQQKVGIPEADYEPLVGDITSEISSRLQPLARVLGYDKIFKSVGEPQTNLSDFL